MSERSSLRVYNTLTRTVEPFVPREPGKVGVYVCGMTVYDLCHIGHARAMMAFDVIVRYLRSAGYEVNHVRNHTDVDDKIIARAKQLGKGGLEVSAEYIAELDRDLDAVGLVRPTVEPRVSTSIPEILEVIRLLMEGGHAYQGASGDIYFSVENFPEYGKLSGRKLEDLRAGERVEVNQEKRHPGDFVLWKSVAGPATVLGAEPCWDSPWGVGRPGWHIECSGMSRRYLGDSFDMHGGGIDLIFPHHENEIAQSECATHVSPMSRYWLHNGHLSLGGPDGPIKMSKSLGNVITIRDLLATVPAEVLRLCYLEVHYRSPLLWGPDVLANATGALDRLYQAKELVEEVMATGTEAPIDSLGEHGEEVFVLASAFPLRFRNSMDDDFNTAAAMGFLFELVRAVNRFGNDRKRRRQGKLALAPVKEAFRLCAEVLGIGGYSPAAFFDELKVKRLGPAVAEVEAMVAARARARAEKDWAAADRLRLELESRNVVVMDGADGSTWRVRVS
ncbi:MAG TPA: cysteine--tRNA ligase [Myxococcota bacterium]|nr:cysteine--tRNA ligase [Myxococcota bacterium]HNH47720.1 cysteine--tRNA ligase [Myxococcota bacterium]